MTTVKEKSESEGFEWSPEDEVQLFFAMDGLKPVGINRHFIIVCIMDRLSKALNREISSETIWSHLRTMYNLKALDDLEQLPFPNEESDFCLPETDFSSIMKRKSIEETSAEDTKKSDPTPKISKDKEQSDKEKDKLTDKEKDSKSAKNKPEIVDNTPKRPQKRTRGSMSLEPNVGSPASTPPNVQSTKRRRI
ncbi:MRG/MORF4L-binding protein [Wyeomyia smithii]|uniref:MRG/MORF4L-binding protein n=1 Tax=Wyeomyia smithii TaxID=174621 RepID=UPI002467ED30|nr:MRG/MORF4L-binding protein [Wyeomyia smithii]